MQYGKFRYVIMVLGACMCTLSAEARGIIDERDAYLSANGRDWQIGWSARNPSGSYIGWGEASINRPAADVRHGQARVAAFERALNNARVEFARTQERTVAVEILRQVFNDDREPDDPSLGTQMSRDKVIMDKLGALAEAEIDAKLRDLNVDPSSIIGRQIDAKRLLAKDAISKTITTRAIQSVVGLTVMNTFEGLDAVGVLVVYSQKLRDRATLIAKGQGVAVADPSIPHGNIKEQLMKLITPWPDGLIYQHGTRLWADENGEYAVVAFGQYTPAVSKSDSQMRKNLAAESARERARELAEAQLAEFLNITTVFQSTMTMEAESAIQELIGPSGLSEVEYDKVGSVIDRVARQNAWNKARGVTVLQQWSAAHPDTGQIVEGMILMWSPSSKRATETGSALKQQEVVNEQRDIKGPVRQGADFYANPDL